MVFKPYQDNMSGFPKNPLAGTLLTRFQRMKIKKRTVINAVEPFNQDIALPIHTVKDSVKNIDTSFRYNTKPSKNEPEQIKNAMQKITPKNNWLPFDKLISFFNPK